MADVLLDVEELVVDIATPRGTLHAVRSASFRIARGETLCLVGEFGCGKSITAFALMGLLPRTATRRARSLLFEGEDLTRASPQRLSRLRGNRMAMVFQEPMTALNPAYTIGESTHRSAPSTQEVDKGGSSRSCRRVAGKSRHHGRGRTARPISAPALGRVTPARDDRHGVDVQPGAARSRTSQPPRSMSPSRRKSCGSSRNWDAILVSAFCSSPTIWVWSRGSLIASPLCMPARSPRPGPQRTCSPRRVIPIRAGSWRQSRFRDKPALASDSESFRVWFPR